MAVFRARVIRHIPDKHFIDRGLTACNTWAKRTIDSYVRPRTPMLTGELRESLDYRVSATSAKNISIVWYARAQHAEYLEDVKKYGAHIAAIRNFTTPGTEAPFLLPNIERGMPTFRRAIQEMFALERRTRAMITFP